MENIETPSIYLEVMQGVSQLTSLYLSVGLAAEKCVLFALRCFAHQLGVIR